MRKRKNELKKALKQALRKQTNEEGLFKLRQEFSSIMRLHNKVRKLVKKKEEESKKRLTKTFERIHMGIANAF